MSCRQMSVRSRKPTRSEADSFSGIDFRAPAPGVSVAYMTGMGNAHEAHIWIRIHASHAFTSPLVSRSRGLGEALCPDSFLVGHASVPVFRCSALAPSTLLWNNL